MKNLTSPIQATPVNRSLSTVKNNDGISASIVGCYDGPLGIKICAPFANANSK